MEREIDQLRRKEGQLKRFKEALKNNQWATEREIKKGIQTCGKSMVNLASEESKDEAVSLMKNLEMTVVRLSCPNIDQI